MVKFKNKYRSESIRLRGWDYTAAGWYFVTLCTHDRVCVFGDVVNDQVALSPLGKTAYQFWAAIPTHHRGIELDAFVIMPNHVHGIIILPPVVTAVETLHATSLPPPPPPSPPPDAMSAISPKPGSLSAVVRSYKSAVTRWAGLNGYDAFAWQSRFYDHIIRSEPSLDRIRQYIVNNPLKWVLDKQHPDRKTA